MFFFRHLILVSFLCEYSWRHEYCVFITEICLDVIFVWRFSSSRITVFIYGNDNIACCKNYFNISFVILICEINHTNCVLHMFIYSVFHLLLFCFDEKF